MEPISEQRRAAMEMNTWLLRERERNLQHLTASSHCSRRAEAELELGRVREQLEHVYDQLRTEHPDGIARPRIPRA